jgi:protein-S-isoprenylcysteine O-methyltransferase Ste14
LNTSRVILEKLSPELLKQREPGIRKDTKPFDKVFMGGFLFLTAILPVVAGLDAVRFNWAPMPFESMYPGVFLFVVSTTLITWTLVKNPHAESSVRIQRDRDHTVVASGPYRFVRHPMYVGLILLNASLALILGSMWTLAIAALIAILVLWRTALEDQTLRLELPGYEEYTSVTRYRLMPWIW